ncbi:winged-helix domain-containing protein [Nocardioides albidus]|uniref:Winged-helix domain-containing protein n=1 Tax=Nocardioides albidus TaxID=1517589 RepID=A0A5C4W7F0_9ACTN|nr:winged helix-turn-helix domain-containing protein [Nocardioides albidus]TNM44108.1 winged-helix domain-containing protein [Nocardioides albidus]
MRPQLRRWIESTGAQLLVVDPDADDGVLARAMAGRGVHVTWVGSTLDALIAYGRTDPHAVVVAPDAPGIAPADFVGLIRGHGSPYVIAGAADHPGDSGPLLLAGAAAVLPRPYAAQRLWELITHAPRSVADHARLEFGPIELDATAYRVRVHGERIPDLPLKEFELLRALMLEAPGVVTDDELRDALWGAEGRRPGGNTIAMHATRLRARLAGVVDVRRIRGRGYSLTVG